MWRYRALWRRALSSSCLATASPMDVCSLARTATWDSVPVEIEAAFLRYLASVSSSSLKSDTTSQLVPYQMTFLRQQRRFMAPSLLSSSSPPPSSRVTAASVQYWRTTADAEDRIQAAATLTPTSLKALWRETAIDADADTVAASRNLIVEHCFAMNSHTSMTLFVMLASTDATSTNAAIAGTATHLLESHSNLLVRRALMSPEHFTVKELMSLHRFREFPSWFVQRIVFDASRHGGQALRQTVRTAGIFSALVDLAQREPRWTVTQLYLVLLLDSLCSNISSVSTAELCGIIRIILDLPQHLIQQTLNVSVREVLCRKDISLEQYAFVATASLEMRE